MEPANINRLITLPERKAELEQIKAELAQAKAELAERTSHFELICLDIEARFDLRRPDIYEAMRLLKEGASAEAMETWLSEHRIVWSA